ncbi:General transcription factor II-I repeat domain-containing protein 2A [Merluccius polli]|uniref:General transcription factor II-I repeat domain-containing protein 2A n=1 Tax=Merluccius polli TaxID=89951 RepID=A0AA47NZB1_MERPO|nr:General transcription factor II-I repeat domain-containing protein 2A [Merluccius polli]
MATSVQNNKRVKTYHFHQEWETEFCFININDKCVCLICGASVSVGKRCNVERHFTKVHGNFSQDFPAGSSLRRDKITELKTTLQRQQSLFTKPAKKTNSATEASFKVAHILTKRKKPFTDGGIIKEAMAPMTAVAETLFRNHKNKTDILSAIADVQLGANTMARRVSALSADAVKQLESDMNRCKWFSIQCDESVDRSDTAQLAVFIRMVFDDFSTKEEFLTLLPLKATTRGVDVYNAVKDYFVGKKIPIEKLVSVTTDGAPAITGRHSGFIAYCRADPDFPKFLNYHCIIHQQAICAKVMGFDHVMTPVIRIINSIRAKAKQHRIFKLFLEECSAEYGDLLLHTEVRWLSRGKILQRFLSLLGEIKAFMETREEDTTLLSDAEWLLDLAFLTDVTEKINHLNIQLQGKGKNICDMISAVKAFSAKLSLYIQQVKNKRFQHFPSVSKMLESHTGAVSVLNVSKYCDLLSRLGQEFADRFSDFEKLEPCVTFMANPFMDVDISEISGQMAELFCVDPVEMEMEVINLQNNVQLKSQQHSQHFWSLVEPDNYENLHQAALKMCALFGSTYLCESAFSDMNVLKSKLRTRLTDEHLNDSIRVNLSGYTPA